MTRAGWDKRSNLRFHASCTVERAIHGESSIYEVKMREGEASL